MPDPDTSVATAAQPVQPGEIAAVPRVNADGKVVGVDAGPPPPDTSMDMSMNQGGGAPPMPGPTHPPVQYGSAVPLEEPRLPDKDAQLKSDSFGTKVYHGVLNALGGSQDTTLTGYDPKTGAPIYSTTPSGPGQQWKRIISGALTGLAAGSQVKGPGSPMRGLGAGVQAVEEQNAQQRQEQRANAQQTFQNQQTAAKNSAEVSMLTNQSAESAFRLTSEKVKASVEDTDRMTKFNSMIADGGSGTRYLNHFASMGDAVKAFQQDPTLHDSHAQGQLVAVPHVNGDGQVEGVDAAYVTKGWMDQKNSKDLTFTTQKYQDGKLQDVTFTLPANSVSNGDAMKLMMGQAKDSMEAHWKQVQTESEAKLRVDQGAEARGKAAEAGATAQKTDAEVKVLNETGEWPGTAGKGGAGTIDPDDMPATVQAVGEGRVSMPTLSRMLSKNPTLAEEITKRYPDFREGMVKTFDKQQQLYTSGNIGGSLNSAGTSVAHLLRLQQLNTPASHIPHSTAWRAYQEQARIASEELAKFYGGGKAAVTQVAGHMEDLGGIGPGRDKAITTAIEALGDKMTEFHQQWNNAMPSQYWTMPMPGITANDEAILAKVDPKYAAAMKTWAPRGVPAPTPTPGAAPGGGAAATPGPPAAAKLTPDQLPPDAIAHVKAGAGQSVPLYKNGVFQGNFKVNQAGQIVSAP